MKYDCGLGLVQIYGILTISCTLFLLQTAGSHHARIKFTIKSPFHFRYSRDLWGSNRKVTFKEILTDILWGKGFHIPVSQVLCFWSSWVSTAWQI